MATGQPGRKYFVERFDVRTFHARRAGAETLRAPAIALELERSLGETLQAEMVALLMELRARDGAGVGYRVTPMSEEDAVPGPRFELELEQLYRAAVLAAGDRAYALPDAADVWPLSVAPEVLTATGELQGTTAQAAPVAPPISESESPIPKVFRR